MYKVQFITFLAGVCIGSLVGIGSVYVYNYRIGKDPPPCDTGENSRKLLEQAKKALERDQTTSDQS